MKTYMVLFFKDGRIEIVDDGDGRTPFVTTSRDAAREVAEATREHYGCRAIVVRVGGERRAA